MRRWEFIAGLAGAVAWPVTAHKPPIAHRFIDAALERPASIGEARVSLRTQCTIMIAI
jgi:hypothetical protein